MKEYNENSLTDELVSRFDLDVGDIDSYFKFYDKDAIVDRLNSGKLNIEQLYDGMAQWLGIANIFESNIDENTTFTQYLNESGFTLKQYTEDVYNACLSVDESKYRNIDLYYSEDIEKAFNEKVPVNTVAADIMSKFDTEFTVPKEEDDEGFTPENGYEDYEKEYGKTLHQLTDENENDEEMEFVDEYDFSNDFNESTSQDDLITDGADYDEWKLNAFKYIDKRVDVNKIKELGKYIKSFLKQEYDNGEPSWFMAAESVVNYVRINYSNCLKDRSYATSITESTDENEQVLVITFDSEDTANEEEYLFANDGGWASQFNIGREGNKIYVEYNKLSDKVTKEWYKDKVELVEIPKEEYYRIFSNGIDESTTPKKVSVPFTGDVVFYTEDQAMDAFGAWNKMQNPKINVGDWFNQTWETKRKMEEYRTYKDVKVEQNENVLSVTADKQRLLIMAMDWLEEFDEDSVKQKIKYKRQK